MRAVLEKLETLLEQSNQEAEALPLLRVEMQWMVSELRKALATAPRPDEPLLAARIGKMKNNKDVKPADLCRAMAHDIDTGFLKADSLVLVYMHRPPDSDWDVGRYTANLTHDQELVALTLAKEKALRAWFK